MKKFGLQKFVVVVLCFFAIGLMSGCDKPKEKKKENVEIVLQEYSLQETGCTWNNLRYDDSVIIINSKEELEQYIDCSSGSYPEIDFSKYTLLLAQGETSQGVDKVVSRFFKDSNDKYALKVAVHLNNATTAEGWSISVLVPKISNEATITLDVLQSVEIVLEEYPLQETNCTWDNLKYNDSIIIINSKEELEQYIDCSSGTYSEIDFSAHTLLIVSGVTGGISNLQKRLMQSREGLLLEITITLNDTAIAFERWQIALIANKLSSQENVKLKVVIIKN